jgi:hypothetical protein
MTRPSGAAAIRNALKEKIQPAVAKAEAEHDKLWALWIEISDNFDKAIADKDVEGMELQQAAFKGYEKKAAVLLTTVESLLTQLDELQKDPDFVEELETFTKLTGTLRDIKGRQRNGLVRVQGKVAEAEKAKQGTRKVKGDVAQQWAVAEAQVAAASKSAAAASEAMKALRQKAFTAASKGEAKTLAAIKAQANALKSPLGDSAFATMGQLLAKTLLFVNKEALDPDAVKIYERDGEMLSEKLSTARGQVVETLRLQNEIDQMTVLWATPLILKTLKMGAQDATRLAKVAQQNPAKLMAELEATIKRLKLEVVAKDVHAALKRLGAL